MKFKKLNLIIGKRQIIIISLLVTLSIAAFLNWQFATGDQSIAVENISENTEKNTKNRTYGEAELVNKSTTTSGVIGSMRLKKEDLHEQQKSYDQEKLSRTDLSEELKDKIINNSLRNEENFRQSQTIDNLIKNDKNTGIVDSVTHINNDKGRKLITTYVKPYKKNSQESLTPDNIASIKDTIVRTTQAEASDIVITPVDMN